MGRTLGAIATLARAGVGSAALGAQAAGADRSICSMPTHECATVGDVPLEIAPQWRVADAAPRFRVAERQDTSVASGIRGGEAI